MSHILDNEVFFFITRKKYWLRSYIERKKVQVSVTNVLAISKKNILGLFKFYLFLT